MASRSVMFALTSQTKVHKGRGKDQKGKGREGTYPQSGFSASKHPMKKDMAMPGNQTIGLPRLVKRQ